MPEDIVREPENVSEGGAGGGAANPSVAYREPPADAEDLIQFVRALEVVVRECVERPALFWPYGRLLRETMPMLEGDLALIVRGLESATEEDLERLAEHGLVGPELELKLKVFYGASGDFLVRLRRYDGRRLGNAFFGHPARKTPLEKPEAETVKREGVPGLRWVRTLAQKGLKGAAGLGLKAADAVLGSVGAAIPVVAIAAAALGETKGIMEAIADSDLSEDAREPEAYRLPVWAPDEPAPG
jgi:hypothetical protein